MCNVKKKPTTLVVGSSPGWNANCLDVIKMKTYILIGTKDENTSTLDKTASLCELRSLWDIHRKNFDGLMTWKYGDNGNAFGEEVLFPTVGDKIINVHNRMTGVIIREFGFNNNKFIVKWSGDKAEYCIDKKVVIKYDSDFLE